MNPNLHKSNKQKNAQSLEAELDKLEDMWDRILDRGDDDYYEAVQFHRQSETKVEEQPTKGTRKRGRRI